MIYLPMTCEILTAGHIKIIKQLAMEDILMVGLLDENALKGYKEVVMSFEDREIILGAIKWVDKLVRQSSLNPYENLVKYKPTHVASGDGWEKEELAAIKKAGCKIIDVRLPGEKKGQKLYSSSNIKILCQKE